MKRRVLLLDDERDTRELLGRALVRAGYDVTTAATAGNAFAIWGDGAVTVDVVVTDVVIGGDDRQGLRFLKELRARGSSAPVIVITAYADVDKVKTALNEGAAHLLEKPFRASELIEAIERILSREERANSVERIFLRAHLTQKERTVGHHLLAGLSSGEIAILERNSPKTIRQHITQIYSKCGVSSRADFFRLMYAR